MKRTAAEISCRRRHEPRGLPRKLAVGLAFCLLHVAAAAQPTALNGLLWNLETDVPAVSAWNDSHSLTLRFRNDYCLKALMHKDIDYVLTRRKNNFHLHLGHYGCSKFGQLAVRAGYARMFGHRVAAGLSFWYLMQHAENYRACNSVTLELSALFRLSDSWGLVLYIFNPTGMKYDFTSQFMVPIRFKVEPFYVLGPKLVMSLLIEKVLPGNFETGLKLGLQPVKVLFLELLCNQRQSVLACSCQWRRMAAGLSLGFNYSSGLSTQCKFSYLFSLAENNTHSRHSAR